ncbi:citrate lyase acyl carrier protein [Citroniella saccharovorans]|uniref:Citrate lyase acyl carrier protein n=1 Tax=Citroniella saccharovorans TaxID=2053367 RepID=A0AAW9MSQ4_9FIRM|nr:citrate lyase acyl carrier protein [Citroniella saccharovorans]MEB3429191.1 citrate lyase acyl carrier protein [Citroniella saccharovorans]
MNIEKEAASGSLQSNDCLVRVFPDNDLKIEIQSSVMKEFGHIIREVAEGMLKELKVQKGKVIIEDKGALDFTIRARIETAVKRSNE